ncbi:hypothetical protein AOZ06_35715 [Kibdelosporangium phytohabitans]|uniref:HTH gntR-type domain-containing protein n=1 Tax=Kibdelosporangium phytohabitans TaxID=860235 RepID=A0A0N9I1Q6_9PSEU|nr:hypothetical protein AOZ06_35715 [Kibdelosporangium phytohabitans]
MSEVRAVVDRTSGVAIKLLRNGGLVVARHGRGVFVRPDTFVTRLVRTRLSRSARAEDKGAFMGDADAGNFVPSISVDVRVEPADDRIVNPVEHRIATSPEASRWRKSTPGLVASMPGWKKPVTSCASTTRWWRPGCRLPRNSRDYSCRKAVRFWW